MALVLTWLRQQPSLRRLPVIIFTSSGESKDIDRAHDLGANSYLVKPHDNDDLEGVADGIKSYWLQRHRFPNCQQV